MARLYSDEQFPFPAVALLRTLGHDVLTAQQAGQANRGVPDEKVLVFAVHCTRAILTQNRRHFVRLHRSHPEHAGIIVCTEDLNWKRLADAIHRAIGREESLAGKLIRVNLPSESSVLAAGL